ncbi:MAG: VWA domain-containing protein [Bacillota bacterium]
MSGAELTFGLALSNDHILAGVPTNLYVLLELTAPRVGDLSRLPLNLAAVLDRSGSMEGNPLSQVKRAAEFLVDHLDVQDCLAVVTYDDQVRVEHPAGPVVNREVVRSAVRRIQAGGMTNLSGGLLTGVAQARIHAGPGRINRVLLLTDGQANVGLTSVSSLAGLARDLAQGGISLSTMGVGSWYNEDLLLAMAEAGKGNYYYIDSAEKLPGIFADELQGLLSVVAQRLHVRFRGLEGARIGRILGEHVPAGEQAALALSDMYSGENRPLLVEVLVPPLAPGRYQLVEVEVEYASVPQELRTVSVCGRIGLEATVDAELLGLGPNLEVVKKVELVQAALARDEAIARADQGDLNGAALVLHQQYASLASAPFTPSDPDVLAELTNLKEALHDLSSGYDPGVRKKMQFQSYRRKKGKH